MNGTLRPRIRFVFRTIALINIGLCVLGAYSIATQNSFMAQQISNVRDPRTPSFAFGFAVAYSSMVLMNITLLIWLAITATKLIRLATNAVRWYCVFVLATIFYAIIAGFLRLAPSPLGPTISAASGIGNLGLAAYEALPSAGIPFVYPIASACVLLVVNRRSTAQNSIC